LPSADHIIALGTDGQVVEQGSFAKLQETGKYIQSLDITDPDSESDDETTSEQDAIEETKKPSECQPDVKEEDRERGQQQTVSSDRSTFKYYFSAMQPLSLAIGGAYIGGQAFCSAFRCKRQALNLSSLSRFHANICRSCLAYVVGRRPRTLKQRCRILAEHLYPPGGHRGYSDISGNHVSRASTVYE
jgi:hypothetical protein